MSSSRHPIARSLEQRVGSDAGLLATVMALPLLDGLFAALVVTGALESVTDIFQIGLLVFGGSATLVVVLVEMDGDRWQRIRTIAIVGVGVIVLAGLEAAIAPTLERVLDLAVFERFAGLVVLVIAAKTASSRFGASFPRPALLLGLGLVASIQPAGATLVVEQNLTVVLRGAAAAGIGVAFAIAVALFGPFLRTVLAIDRFRIGSALALATLALAILDFVPPNAPLVVLLVTAILSFDPHPVEVGAPGAGGEDADNPAVENKPWS